MINHRSTILLLAISLAAGAINPLLAQSNINVPAGTSVTLNQSASYQNVTVGSGGSLETIDANSGGGGDHAIIITLAVGGAGTIQNNGAIVFAGNDQGNTTVFANPVTLSGSGTLTLVNTAGFNDASVQGPGTVTQAAGHTLIGGGGRTGDPGPSFSAPLVNHGLVTTSSLGFVLNGASLVNSGTFSASGGATLTLAAPTLNNTNGTITVDDANSVVLMNNGIVVTGGTFQSIVPAPGGGNTVGVFRLQGGATLANLTIAVNAGVYLVDAGTLAGTITNNGYVYVYGGSFHGNLSLAGNVTLAGSGTVYLGGNLQGASNATLTIGQGQTLDLEGQSDTSGTPDTIAASVVNNGTLADVYLQGLISGPVFTNNGLLAANNGSNLSVSSSTNFTNYNSANQTLTGGAYTLTDQGNGATLDFSGRNVLVNAAAITLSGANANFSALNGVTTNAGTLTLLNLKQFSTSSALVNNGALALDAGTTLHTGGGFGGGANSKLAVTVGGAQSQGAQSAGVLQINGAGTLGGTLTITLGAGAQIAATDTITILAATGALSGKFANVPNGERIATTDGTGTFQVNYGAASPFATNGVVLSDFASTGVVTHPSFFTNEIALSNGVYYLAFDSGNYFGYYSYLSNSHYIYHFDLGYEYVFDAADGKDGVYFYDFKSQTFFYTSPVFPFPYLYDFSLNTVLYYYPDPKNAGHYNTDGVRYFYDFATGKIITK